MVGVPAGSFLMGSSTAEIKRGLELLPPDESEADKLTFATEQPQHSVTIARSFGMSSYLVTRDEYAAFVRETDYSSSGDCTLFVNHRYEQRADAGWRSPGFAQSDRDPAVCVSWHDALAYITWLNSRLRGRTSVVDDGPYRLPSEAEWEYAARAGTKTVRWWGDSIGSDNANCEGCGSRWDDKQPAPVGSFHPNPFGLFDMLGNVWEWTQDCWNKSYEGAPVDGSAWTVGKWCQYRAIRGGSFASRPWLLRPAKRTFLDSDRSANYVGFRVVKALQ
jgi:formylglycine-generating enzyme required for sulfatase activity